MKRIVAIGGGDLGNFDTFLIDCEIVNLTGKKRPKALFIGTASGDSERYIEKFIRVYGKALGCYVEVLTLSNENLKSIEHKIMNADLIYVGGGNTLEMLEVWKKHRVHIFLKRAWKKGIVLSGLSAGSICWFKSGHSDSMKYYNENSWHYIKVDGLGFINAMNCPHFDEDKREEDFSRMILNYDTLGIALQNNCAIEIVDERYRIISSKKGAKAYKLYRANGCIVKEEIKKKSTYSSLHQLLKK